jgi:tetratricopeptide (TPR) repeat protein
MSGPETTTRKTRGNLAAEGPSSAGSWFARSGARETLLCCAVIAGLTLAVYAPLLLPGFEFLSWDDTSNIVDNPLISNPDAVDLVSLCTSATLGVYEPLGVSLKLGLVSAFGMQVQPFQIATLLFHLANACLLFMITRHLLGLTQSAHIRDSARANLAALLASLFYAVHPLRVEAVAWASGQSYVMAATFLLLALLAYLRHCEALATGQSWRLTGCFALSLLAFACAVLSKSAAIFLPVVLLVLDFYPLRRRHWVNLVLEKFPYGVICAGAAGVAFWATAGAQAENSLDLDLTTRFAYSLRSFLFHLRLTVWPDQLLPIYPATQSVATPFSEVFLIYTIGVVALCVVAWRLRQRAPWCAACWCAYIVGMLPVSGLIPHGVWTLGADRYTYMTTFCFYVLLGAWITSPTLLPRLTFGDARGRIVAVTIVAALCVLGISSRRQIDHWKNTEALWRYTIRQDPANPIALNNLGYHYLELGRHAEAIPLLGIVVAVDPGNLKAVLNLGYSLEKAGRLEEAVGTYKRALMSHGGSGALHNNLGVIYYKLGAHEAARIHSEQAKALGFPR